MSKYYDEYFDDLERHFNRKRRLGTILNDNDLGLVFDKVYNALLADKVPEREAAHQAFDLTNELEVNNKHIECSTILSKDGINIEIADIKSIKVMDRKKFERFKKILTALGKIQFRSGTTRVKLAIELSKFESIHEHEGVLLLLEVLNNNQFTPLPDDPEKWVKFIEKMVERNIPKNLLAQSQQVDSIQQIAFDFLGLDEFSLNLSPEENTEENREQRHGHIKNFISTRPYDEALELCLPLFTLSDGQTEEQLIDRIKQVYERAQILKKWDEHQISERLVAQLKYAKYLFTPGNTSHGLQYLLECVKDRVTDLAAFGARLNSTYDSLPVLTRRTLLDFGIHLYTNSSRILAAQKSRGFDTLLAYIGQQDSPTEILESILVNKALIDKLKENLKYRRTKTEKEEIVKASDISILLSSFIQLEAGEELSVMRVINSLNTLNRDKLDECTQKILKDMSIIVNKVGFDTPAILNAIVNSGLIELLIDAELVNNKSIDDLSNIIKWVLKNILGESLGFDNEGAKDLCTVVSYILGKCTDSKTQNKEKLKEVIKCVLQQPFDLNKVLDYVFQMDIEFTEDSKFYEALSSYIINFLTKYDENTQALSDIGLNDVFVKNSNFHNFLTDILKAVLKNPKNHSNTKVMNLNLLMDALYPFDLNRFLLALSQFNEKVITSILKSSTGKDAIMQIIRQLSKQSDINLSPTVIEFIKQILNPEIIYPLLKKMKTNTPLMEYYNGQLGHNRLIKLLNQSERNYLFSHQQEDDLILEFRAVLDKHDKEVSLGLSKADITSIIEAPTIGANETKTLEQLLAGGTNPKALLAFGIPIKELARIHKKISTHSSQAKYATFWKRYDDLLKAAELDQTKDSELTEYLNKKTALDLEEEIALYKDLSDMSEKCRWLKLLRAVKTDYQSFSVKCNAEVAIGILDNIHKNLEPANKSPDYLAIEALYKKLQDFKNGDDPDFDAKVINLIKTKLRNKETDLFNDISELLMGQKSRSEQYEKGEDPLVKLYEKSADKAVSAEETKILYQTNSLGPNLLRSIDKEEALKLFEAMTKPGSPLQKLNKLIKKPITDFLTPNQTTMDPTTPPNGKKTKRDLLISTLAEIDTRTLSDDGPKMTAKDLCNLLSINIIEEHVAEAGNISIGEKDIINLCKLLDSLKDGNFDLDSFKSVCLSCREIIKLANFLINETEYSKSLWLGFLQFPPGQLEQLKGIIKLTDELFNMKNIGDTSQLFQHQFPRLIKMITQLNPGDKDGLIDMFAKNHVKSIHKIEDDDEYNQLKKTNEKLSQTMKSTDEQSERQYLKNDVSIRYYEWMKYGGQKAENDEKIRSFFLSEFHSGNKASQALLKLKIKLADKLAEQSSKNQKKKIQQEIDALEKTVKSNESMIRTIVSTCQNKNIANLLQVISTTKSDELFDTTIGQFHENGMHTMIALADHFHTGYPFKDLARLISQLPTIKKYSKKIEHIKDIFGIKHTENRDRVTDLVQYLKSKYQNKNNIEIKRLVGNIIDNNGNIVGEIDGWNLDDKEMNFILQRWKMTQYGYEHLAKRFKGTMAHTFDLKSVMFIPHMEKQSIDSALEGGLSDREIPIDTDSDSKLNDYKISYLEKIAGNCNVKIPNKNSDKISLFDRLNDINVDIKQGILCEVVSNDDIKLQNAFDEEKKLRVIDAVRSGYKVDTKTPDPHGEETRLGKLLTGIMDDKKNPIRRKEYTQGFFFKKQQFGSILSSGVSLGHVSATKVLIHVARSLITDTTMNIVTSKLLGVDVDCDEEYDPYQILEYDRSTILGVGAHIHIYDALDFIVKRQECLKLLKVSQEIGKDDQITAKIPIDNMDFNRDDSAFETIQEMKNFATKLTSGKYQGYALQCCRYLKDPNIGKKLNVMSNKDNIQPIAPSFYKNRQKIIHSISQIKATEDIKADPKNDDSQQISLYLRQTIARNIQNLVYKFLEKVEKNDQSINHVLRFLDSLFKGGVLKPLSKSDYEPLQNLTSDLVHDIRFIAESIISELKTELLSLGNVEDNTEEKKERRKEIEKTIQEMNSQSNVERLLQHIGNYLNWRTGNFTKNKGFNSFSREFSNGVMSLWLILCIPFIAIYKAIVWLIDVFSQQSNNAPLPTLERNLYEELQKMSRENSITI